MQFIWAVVVVVGMLLQAAYAGDDASGAIPFRVDLSQQFTTYAMTAQDKLWSASLATRFVYKGKAIHFVQTSLPLNMGEKTIQGAVYQAVEKPEVFYVANSDAMLKIGTTWAYNPGVGGFSMHAPKSRNFCCVFSLRRRRRALSIEFTCRRGVVTWKGHEDWDRLK